VFPPSPPPPQLGFGANSSTDTLSGNLFHKNGHGGDPFSNAISLQNTTSSLLFNNVIGQNNTVSDFAKTAGWTHDGNRFAVTPVQKTNAIGGKVRGSQVLCVVFC
jgi:hypothetical protein